MCNIRYVKTSTCLTWTYTNGFVVVDDDDVFKDFNAECCAGKITEYKKQNKNVLLLFMYRKFYF